jgi:hypothetical protein
MGDTDSVFWRCYDLLNENTPIEDRKKIFELMDKKIDQYLRY